MDQKPKHLTPDATEQVHEDEFHIYVRHDGRAYFLADDGTFVPDLRRGRAFQRIEDAFDALNAMVGDRALGRDEPGVAINAWRHFPEPD